ncbi:elongation factor Ts, mitochondrial [Anastrepha obliqua]|uniref:elongation factor Ts, mitochondrial n=1 Tax=Anastrepha obliqua TaxID=95512 RepID=UPI00240A3D97|nr:elongation factor Ts, mitochondrial [Anastrepha obliqua]
MLLQHFTRAFHTTRLVLAGAEKSALAALRKKTGYTFANCKKALEMHNNDINLAEKWLNEQAQSLGWSKATKLAERATAQGLVGVLIHGNIGAMVEVNCETDFVARNEHFKNFVDHVSRICAKYTEITDFDGDLWKLGFEAEALRKLRTTDGKTLGDQLALLIGAVGENASIKRAICFKTSNDLQLAGYAHPTSTNVAAVENTTQIGKYGAIVAFRGASVDEELQKHICQHIVGLNPVKIGEEGKDKPMANKDDETCLIHQEYLIDPDRTVGEVLKENNVTIIDYQRYECGEVTKSERLEQVKLSN